eukprot:197767_1
MATQIQQSAIIMKHERLIQELETKYLDLINALLKEKASLHQKLQRTLYTELQQSLNHTLLKDTDEEEQDTSCAMLCNTTISMYVSDESDSNALTNQSITKKNTANITSIDKFASYPCDECASVYSAKSSLTRHKMKKHQPHTPLQHKHHCTYTDCEKSFPTTTRLTEHLLQAHSDERPWECNECDRAFKLKRFLHAHIRDVHKGFPIQCEHCNETFKYVSQMRRHLSTIHVDDLDDTDSDASERTKDSDDDTSTMDKVRPRSFTTLSKTAVNQNIKQPTKKRKRRPQFKSPPSVHSEKNQKTAAMFKNQGNQLLKQRKYKEAIAKYTAAIALDGANAICFSNRAAVQTHLKRYEESIADAQMASSIDPNYVKAYVREAYAEYKLNHFQKSLDAYAKALGLTTPSHPDHAMYSKQIKLCQRKLDYHQKTKQRIVPKSSRVQYECDICHKVLLTKQGLTFHHINMHTPNEQKPFRCIYCDYGTCTKWAIDRHISTHMTKQGNLKQIQCKRCNETFTHKAEYVSHINKAHKQKEGENDNSFKCTQCEYKASSKKSLELHQMTHDGEKAFRCDVCGKQYVDLDDLTKHKNTHPLMRTI